MFPFFLLACNSVEKQPSSDHPTMADTSENSDDSGMMPTAEPIIVRLTHLQWENTVQTLLKLNEPTGLSELFIRDTLSDGFNNEGDDLIVGAMLFQDYQNAAEQLAMELVGDPGRYADVVLEDVRIGNTGIAYQEQFEAEDLTGTTGQASGTHYNLWSAGTISTLIDIPQHGNYTVSTHVWASVCDDGYGADMAIIVDGQTLSSFENVIEEQTLSGTVNLSPGQHEISIAFENDCYAPELGFDRNLYIDWISIEGGQTLGESTAGTTEAEAWIRRFGALAFRRPVEANEIDSYLNLFQQGSILVNTGDDFADGIQVVVQAMLQSPFMLYRVVDANPGQALNDHELAAKLSYNICDIPPDEELREIVAQGQMHHKLEEQALRLLNDSCGEDRIVEMHRHLMHTRAYDNIVRDDPDWTVTLNHDMALEVDLFVAEALFTENGGFRELLTASYTVANETLADLYGVDASTGWLRRELDPNQRAGLLTLIGFLSENAEGMQSDPIHRGVFINESLLCNTLPPPPDNVSGLPELSDGMTNRERVEAHTGAGTCGEGCHSLLINPPGFAFEHYEGLGRYREIDNEHPIDSSGSIYIDGIEHPFEDGVDFSWLVAESEQAHRCYVEHLFRFVNGREAYDLDSSILDDLKESSLSDNSVFELILQIIVSDGFTHRSSQ